jgi:hypothetical protein
MFSSARPTEEVADNQEGLGETVDIRPTVPIPTPIFTPTPTEDVEPVDKEL